MGANLAKFINDDNDGNYDTFDFEELFDGDDDNNTFIESVGLNFIVSLLATVLMVSIVYCICCRKRQQQGYGRVDNVELNVDHDDGIEQDQLPIKEDL